MALLRSKSKLNLNYREIVTRAGAIFVRTECDCVFFRASTDGPEIRLYIHACTPENIRLRLAMTAPAAPLTRRDELGAAIKLLRQQIIDHGDQLRIARFERKAGLTQTIRDSAAHRAVDELDELDRLQIELEDRVQTWSTLTPSPRERAQRALEIAELERDITFFQAHLEQLRKQLGLLTA
jgi:hypothetical protein